MIRFWNGFTKVTGVLLAKIIFKTRIHYEDKDIQSRKIKGGAIIISNHISIYDFAVYLFVFFSRTLRCQVAEVLFEKKVLGHYLKWMGEIYVNRNTYDFDFMIRSEDILRKGGVVLIFPESRLPRKEEERPLPFKTSAAFLALSSGVPVIPVFTNGKYFKGQKAEVIIGKPMMACDFVDESLSDNENIKKVSDAFRNKITELGNMLDERTKKA